MINFIKKIGNFQSCEEYEATLQRQDKLLTETRDELLRLYKKDLEAAFIEMLATKGLQQATRWIELKGCILSLTGAPSRFHALETKAAETILCKIHRIASELRKEQELANCKTDQEKFLCKFKSM